MCPPNTNTNTEPRTRVGCGSMCPPNTNTEPRTRVGREPLCPPNTNKGTRTRVGCGSLCLPNTNTNTEPRTRVGRGPRVRPKRPPKSIDRSRGMINEVLRILPIAHQRGIRCGRTRAAWRNRGWWLHVGGLVAPLHSLDAMQTLLFHGGCYSQPRHEQWALESHPALFGVRSKTPTVGC